MKKNKSKLESLSKKQILEIEKRAEARTDVPTLRSQQVNMRLKAETLEKAKKLAATQGVPYTSFLSKLLKEDIDRLWNVYKKAE